jgi:hypothetical protein
MFHVISSLFQATWAALRDGLGLYGSCNLRL